MKTLAIRSLLFFCVVMTIVVRLNSAQYDVPLNLSNGVELIVSERGLKLLPRTGTVGSVRRSSVRFLLEACSEPAIAIPFHISLDTKPYLRVNRVEDYNARFHYLDRTFEQPNKVGLLMHMAEQRLRFALGATSLVPVPRGLIVATPKNCAAAVDINFSDAWRPIETTGT